MKGMTAVLFAVMLLLLGPIPVLGMQELSENELDEITAGGISANIVDGVLQFQFAKETASGRYVEGSGTVSQLAQPLSGGSSSILLRDNAQSNLSSFITVNAVNSVVQLLVNLNININSVIGTLGQSNTSGP